MLCKSLPKMKKIGFMFVLDKKERDCIIIENPLNDMIEEIKDKERGVMFLDNCFTPFVISTMPDITLCESAMFSLFMPINEDKK